MASPPAKRDTQASREAAARNAVVRAFKPAPVAYFLTGSLVLGFAMPEVDRAVPDGWLARVGFLYTGSAEGAKIVLGGDDSPRDRGWYVRPTLFVDATNDMTIARQEIFGPVLTVIKYRDEQDAVRIANDSDYGLAGSVWTKDVAHGLEISGQIRTGTYGINMYMLDISSPFGGFKQSGIGREFAEEGLAEYTELQTVVSAGRLPALGEDQQR